MNALKLFICTLFVFLVVQAFGQGGRSPYSILGVGDIVGRGNVANLGMGGIAVSNGSPLFGNVSNPANLAYNKLTFFDIGYMGEFRQLSYQDAKEDDLGGQILYMSFGFPITRNWTTSIGLRPVTQVNYKIQFTELLPNSQTYVQYVYQGEGGITQVYWANGINLFKGFAVGGEISYNFGSINRQSKSTLQDLIDPQFSAAYFQRTTYSAFTFTGSAAYSAKLSDKFQVNVGAQYLTQREFTARSFEALQRRSAADAVISSDTLVNNERATVQMPGDFTFGISLGQEFKYTLGVDVTMQNWSSYRDTQGRSLLKDARSIKFGAEWIPDITSVSSYFKRVAYRIGGSVSTLPYVVEGEQLEDMAATMGFSLPVSRGISTLNLAFQYGIRDLNLEDSIKEKYFRVNLGFTINDRWFVRRRIN